MSDLSGFGRQARFLFAARNVHVEFTSGSLWGIRRECNEHFSSLGPQSEIMSRATKIAKSEGVDLVIHDRLGQVVERRSYQ